MANEEVGDNIQRIYSYGIRNSFGMAVDPKSGNGNLFVVSLDQGAIHQISPPLGGARHAQGVAR